MIDKIEYDLRYSIPLFPELHPRCQGCGGYVVGRVYRATDPRSDSDEVHSWHRECFPTECSI